MDALIPFTTSGSLVDLVDKKVMVILRDGRKLLGVFRSYDQYANFLLESTVERLHYKLDYADRDIGILLIRGENVVALGEVDLIAEDMVPLRQVSVEEIEPRIREEAASRQFLGQMQAARCLSTGQIRSANYSQKRKERDSAVRERALGSLGFVTEGQEGDAY